MASEKDKKVWSDSKAESIWQTSSFHLWTGCKQVFFTSDNSTIVNQQVKSISSILGDRCILELIGEDHKRVRDALISFLKPESLNEYVEKMDEEIRKHLEMH